jgi:hypothetical protein
MRVISLRVVEQIAFETGERQGGLSQVVGHPPSILPRGARGLSGRASMAFSRACNMLTSSQVAGLSARWYIYREAPRLRGVTSKSWLSSLSSCPLEVAQNSSECGSCLFSPSLHFLPGCRHMQHFLLDWD